MPSGVCGGQRTILGISSLFPPPVSQVSNSGLEASWQALLPAKPFCLHLINTFVFTYLFVYVYLYACEGCFDINAILITFLFL